MDLGKETEIAFWDCQEDQEVMDHSCVSSPPLHLNLACVLILLGTLQSSSTNLFMSFHIYSILYEKWNMANSNMVRSKKCQFAAVPLKRLLSPTECLNWFCEDTAEGKVLNGGLVSDEDMQHELRPYRCWLRGLPFLLYSRNPHLLATAGKLWVSFWIWECCWRVSTWLLCKLSHLRPHFPHVLQRLQDIWQDERVS